jgi:hypothetical protein
LERRGCFRNASYIDLAEFQPRYCARYIVTQENMVDFTPQDIAVEVRSLPAFDPSQPSKSEFGRLIFKGGLVLSSPSKHFGGYSAMAVDDRGERFLAIADTGTWLTGRIERADGQLNGVTNARIGSIPQDGRPSTEKSMRDVEGLVQLDPGPLEGSYLLTYEGEHRMQEYVLEGGAFRQLAGRPLPKAFDTIRDGNEGLEGATLLRGGRFAGGLALFAETPLTGEVNLTGALIRDGKTETLTLQRRENFSISDVQSLADGSLLFLERSFDLAKQQRVRLRLVKTENVKPDTIMDGEILLDATRNMATKEGHEIDNFEGLAVHTTAQGETVLTLISDDNFSPSQRTLMLQFQLK